MQGIPRLARMTFCLTMADQILLAFSTFPDAETARRISQTLVSETFAACANIMPAVESIYRWKEKVETSAEVIAFFKDHARIRNRVSRTRCARFIRTMSPR